MRPEGAEHPKWRIWQPLDISKPGNQRHEGYEQKKEQKAAVFLSMRTVGAP